MLDLSLTHRLVEALPPEHLWGSGMVNPRIIDVGVSEGGSNEKKGLG